MDKRIRILYIIGTLRTGGAERHLVQLLRGIDRGTFDPEVCCIKKVGGFVPLVEDTGIPVLDLGIDRYYSFRAIRKFFSLVRFIRNRNFQIVHTFLFHTNIFGSLAAFLARKPKIVISIRNMNIFFTARHIYAIRLIGFLVDKVTVVSDHVKDLVLRREKLKPEKVVTIYNGVDIADLQCQVNKEKKREEIGLDTGGPVLGCVASLHARKGHRYLIQALGGAVQTYPDLSLLLIGDGAERAEIEKQVQALDLARQVKFLGRRSDVPELLELMDIFVLPSLEEGMSNALLEAAAKGKPVVATDVGGNAEMVVHAETGLVVPARDVDALRDAILALLRDRQKASAMGEKGRERMLRFFSLKNIIEQNQALYRELLGTDIADTGK